MAHVRWTADAGWHGAELRPYGPLTFDPASPVLHYAQEIFEGLKAYRHGDGSVWCFRPERNAARFRQSADRLALPRLDDATFIESLRVLVEKDAAWVPTPQDASEECSLYLRPFMIANGKFLGVKPATEVDYYLIASPAASYFKGAGKPVSIWLSAHYNRAAARRHGVRQDRRQLCLIARGPAGSPSTAAVIRSLSWTRPRTNGLKSWAA